MNKTDAASSSRAIAAWSVGAIVRRAAAATGSRNLIAAHAARSSTCAIRRPSMPSSQHERPEYVFLAAAKVGGIHANDTLSGRFHPRQSADRDERDRCRASATASRKLLFLGLELHLSEARAAADAGRRAC